MTDALKALTSVGKPRVEAVEFGDTKIFVRGMGSHQRAVFLGLTRNAVLENSNVPDHTVVALGLCNEDGSWLPQTTEELFAALHALDGRVLYKIAKKVLKLSGLDGTAVEEAEKN